MLEKWKMSGNWIGLTSALSLGLGLAILPGCSGADDDDDASAATGTPAGDDDSPEASPTPAGDDDSPEASPTPSGDDDATSGDDDATSGDDDATSGDDDATSGDDDDSPAALVTLTINVDTTSMADGTNHLAWVDTENGEQVFIVGPLNGWDPQDPEHAMTDNGDGTFTFEIEFPFTDAYGAVYNPGDETAFEFKFTKTTDNVDNPWANGVKEYHPTSEAGYECETPTWNNESGTTEDYTGGLYETTWILSSIPAADETMDVVVDAWRDYAEGFGYPSCN